MLLVVRVLEDGLLQELASLAVSLEMVPLVEVHREEELERALRVEGGLLGINNRDLESLEVDLATSRRLAQGIPPGRPWVSESGIRHRRDVEEVADWGAWAVLVGERLMRAEDPGGRLRSLLGVPRR